MTPDPVLNPQQVADELGVTVHTVREWLRLGELPGAKRGNRWFIRRSAVETFLQPETCHAVA